MRTDRLQLFDFSECLTAKLCRGARFFLLLTSFVAIGSLPATAQQAADSEEEEAEEAAEQLVIDLGMIRVKEHRPTRNETIKLNFRVHFVMNPEITEADREMLESWKHRLRDQVIVAVRTTRTKDFLESGLTRLRRIILFRVEHMLRARIVDSLLLSDYSFSVD